MKTAILPNGMAINITDDQATKIRHIQDCIRSQRPGHQTKRYYIRDSVKSLAVVHDRNMAETIADTYKRKGHKGVEIIDDNNTIELFAVGDSYEAYNESAEALHDICNQPLYYQGNISTTYFRTRCADWIFPKMIRNGYKICIFEKGQF